MNSAKTPKEIASTLVHEIGHFLNSSLCARHDGNDGPNWWARRYARAPPYGGLCNVKTLVLWP